MDGSVGEEMKRMADSVVAPRCRDLGATQFNWQADVRSQYKILDSVAEISE